MYVIQACRDKDVISCSISITWLKISLSAAHYSLDHILLFISWLSIIEVYLLDSYNNAYLYYQRAKCTDIKRCSIQL